MEGWQLRFPLILAVIFRCSAFLSAFEIVLTNAKWYKINEAKVSLESVSLSYYPKLLPL